MSVKAYAVERYEVGRTYRFDYPSNVIRLSFMTIKKSLDYEELASHYYARLIDDKDYGSRLRYLVARIDWLLLHEPLKEEDDTVIMSFHLRENRFYDDLLENIERMTELKFYEIRANEYNNWEATFKGKFEWKNYEIERRIISGNEIEGGVENLRDRL